jgi:hypothetical protein
MPHFRRPALMWYNLETILILWKVLMCTIFFNDLYVCVCFCDIFSYIHPKILFPPHISCILCSCVEWMFVVHLLLLCRVRRFVLFLCRRQNCPCYGHTMIFFWQFFLPIFEFLGKMCFIHKILSFFPNHKKSKNR